MTLGLRVVVPVVDRGLSCGSSPVMWSGPLAVPVADPGPLAVTILPSFPRKRIAGGLNLSGRMGTFVLRTRRRVLVSETFETSETSDMLESWRGVGGSGAPGTSPADADVDGPSPA